MQAISSSLRRVLCLSPAAGHPSTASRQLPGRWCCCPRRRAQAVCPLYRKRWSEAFRCIGGSAASSPDGTRGQRGGGATVRSATRWDRRRRESVVPTPVMRSVTCTARVGGSPG